MRRDVTNYKTKMEVMIMNKKKLSVVMAGAMLATTVAPVMAATTATEIQASNLGLLIGKVRETLLSKKFSNVARNGNLAGQYVYFVKIDGKESAEITAALEGKTFNGNKDVESLQTALQNTIGKLNDGQTVEIWSRGFVEEGNNVYATKLEKDYSASDMNETLAKTIIEKAGINGNIFVGAVTPVANTEGSSVNNPDSSSTPKKPVQTGSEASTGGKDTLKPIVDDGAGKKAVQTTSTGAQNVVVDANKSVTINLNPKAGTTSPIVIKPGTAVLDFTKYIDANGDIKTITDKLPASSADFCGFPAKAENDLEYNQDIPDQLVESFKIVGNSANTFKTSDLFNGVMLTTEGHDLLTKLKESNPTLGKLPNANVKFATLTGLNIGSATYNLPQSSDGNYGFTVTVTDKFGKTTTYTVKGGNKNDTQNLLNWLFNEKASVDILAGKDRYATAVEVAKEYADVLAFTNNGNQVSGNIVIVNGNSLVDGLSASPLAAKLKAPMLLVEKDRVPKATADYIRTLVAKASVGNLSGITINIVGGTGVISKDVERELKSYGFTVNRFGGRDREDTSMKVAKKIGNNDGAFVVGADGEADAMSIASVASSATLSNTGISPIIVSNRNGLSEDTLEYLNKKTVTVVGGESVVSKSEFDNIKEAVGTNNQVTRLAGENRQETNAKVINEYYAGKFGAGNDVLVAKDGIRNKMELVDALTVSNLAALKNAPIVLATNKLDKAQINALELNAKKANALYQVGHGVNIDVVKTLATMLGLEK